MIVNWASVSPLTPSEVNSLWDMIQAVNTDLHKTLDEQVAVAVVVTKKWPKRCDAKQDERGDGMGTIAKVDVELDGKGEKIKLGLEHGVMNDEESWMDGLMKPTSKPQTKQ